MEVISSIQTLFRKQDDFYSIPQTDHIDAWLWVKFTVDMVKFGTV